jgi:hypothetical protein
LLAASARGNSFVIVHEMQTAGGPAREATRWRADGVFVLVAIAGLLLARIPLIPVRVFDPDELEHSHAAWSLFRGLCPYRDFFEHHTPWYYYALAPFFRWFAVDQSFESARRFLIFGRALSLAVTALSVVLVVRIARLGASRMVGLLAGLFLLAQPVLIQKTLEIRPDVLALPFFLGGLWFLLRGLADDDASATGGSLRWFLGGGLCLGAAIMCTQKMLFVLPGALTGLGLWTLAGGRRRVVLGRGLALLTVLAGVAVPVALTWAAFAAHHGGGQFIYNNFLINARWRLRSNRHVLVTLETSGPIIALALLGAALAVRRFFQSAQRRFGEIFLLSTLAGLVAGVAVVPAAYRQYYLMPLPIVCVFAAQGLVFLVGLARERSRTWLLVAATVPLLIWPVVDLARSFGHRNDLQMARLRFVFEHTRPTDTVVDGWLGTAVFRPHPLYYFFMHSELLAMVSDKDKDAWLDALESGRIRPALITLDDELPALGPRFARVLRRDYVSTDGLFYFRASDDRGSPR